MMTRPTKDEAGKGEETGSAHRRVVIKSAISPLTTKIANKGVGKKKE